MAEAAEDGPAGRGVVYIVTGAAHTEAARQSALSVRAHEPGARRSRSSATSRRRAPEFDRVEPIADPHVRSKVDYLPRTPFAETLYLDSDTRVLGPLDDLFDVLERFDLAIAQRARVRPNRKSVRWRHDVPAAFPEHNGGVILYRSSPAALGFLEAWRDAYAEAGFKVDQITLRELLWSTDLGSRCCRSATTAGATAGRSTGSRGRAAGDPAHQPLPPDALRRRGAVGSPGSRGRRCPESDADGAA